MGIRKYVINVLKSSARIRTRASNGSALIVGPRSPLPIKDIGRMAANATSAIFHRGGTTVVASPRLVHQVSIPESSRGEPSL